VTRREADGVRVEIHDTGVGIPPELRERIFEPFFTTKPVGVGTGLGLPICRRLVSEMEGTLGVESRPGRGSMFWVRLRAAREEEARREVKATAPRPGLGVLVLDDEVALGQALQRLLSKRHQVTACHRAQDALAHITSGRRFDAILCDLMMPEMSGFQFHQELERLVPEQARRVIFMTGGAFTEESRAFLSATRYPCLDKPIDFQRLSLLLDALSGSTPLPPAGIHQAAPSS
jgi:CheY-like chemotaxis protein